MIKFRKILSYNTRPESGDVFAYLSDLTSQKIDPESFEPDTLICDSNIVFHSRLKRCVQCLHKVDGVEYVGLKELNEIVFDLEKLCGKDAWEKEGSVAVRRAFKRGFVEDALTMSRHEMFDEVRKVLSLCLDRSKDGDVFVVSHSFRLAIIHAYIETNGLIEKEPQLIENYIFDDRKRYDFGGGFECEGWKLDF